MDTFKYLLLIYNLSINPNKVILIKILILVNRGMVFFLKKSTSK